MIHGHLSYTANSTTLTDTTRQSPWRRVRHAHMSRAMRLRQPYAAFAELNGFGKRLWVPYDSPMGKTNLGFVASTAFIRKEPDLTRTLVRAHVAATERMRTDPAIAVATTVKQFNMSQEIAKFSTKNLFFSAESGEAFQTGLKSLAAMMLTDKMLDQEPNWAEFINTSFL